jgi:L-ascorbate metabolism protein UlaG (beta-lactamase superfamily)
MYKRTLILVLALCLMLAGLPANAAGWSDGKGAMTYLGHSVFTMTRGDVSLIIDPYLTGNPQAAVTADAVNVQYILVTHAHGDHLGDTVAIAKRTGAKIITTSQIARMLASEGVSVIPLQTGAKKQFDFGFVRVTPAIHESGTAGGLAVGYIINFYGTVIYHAGDTALFGDMALLGQLEKIDYALLPIGDNYTMGPDDAVLAVGMLRPKAVVPMHYNTQALIMQDPVAFKQAVEKRFGVPVYIMKSGDVRVF